MRYGLPALLITLISDQVSKYYLVGFLQNSDPVEIAPIFRLVLVWNRGVSFGMLNSTANPDLQRWLLMVVGAIMVVGLLIWLSRAPKPLIQIALGLVAGGAIGNIIDRGIYGAVADFFDFHAFGWHWPAFNIADSGICIGVGLLIVDSLFDRTERPKI